jgi:hypothetical protein
VSDRQEAVLSFFQQGARLDEAALMYASLRLFVHPLKAGGKQPVTKRGWHDATTSTRQIRKWWPNGESNYNIGIALRFSSLAVIDVDPRNGGDETLGEMKRQNGPIPPTYTVRTGGGGLHYYYRVDPSFYEQNELPKILGPGLELLTNHYVVAPPSVLDEGSSYAIKSGTLEEDFATLPIKWLGAVSARSEFDRYQRIWSPEDEDWYVPEGERDNTLTAIAGWARRMGASIEEMEAIMEAFIERFDNHEEMRSAIPRVARSVARYRPEAIRFNDLRLTMKPRRRKPELSPVALYGSIGRWVRRIEPITEAHPAALLSQALAAFGNIIGAERTGSPAPGFFVEDTRHRTALYVNVIGDSAKSGKGDSWSRVRRLMAYVDPKWVRQAGVQTGEGLIDSLADDQELEESTTINGKEVQHVKKGGNRDRRYFIIEPEFGRTLHVSDRKGSTLKDVYRDLWDEGSTAKVTAGSKQSVTDATVSLVAHITKPELERDIDPIDLMSGFGNRFLHVYTERTKVLPSARSVTKSELKRYAQPLIEALAFAREEAPINYPFSNEAWDLWCDLCEQFAKQHNSPLIDSLTARARPIVRRLAVIYAVVDLEDAVHIEHLEAAYALWDYCVQTVEYVFGSLLGDRDADKLYRALMENRAGLTTSEVYKHVFRNNRSAAQVKRAAQMLIERGMIQVRKEKMGKKTTEVFIVNPEAI